MAAAQINMRTARVRIDSLSLAFPERFDIGEKAECGRQVLTIRVADAHHPRWSVEKSPRNHLSGVFDTLFRPGQVGLLPDIEADEVEEPLPEVVGNVVECPGMSQFVEHRSPDREGGFLALPLTGTQIALEKAEEEIAHSLGLNQPTRPPDALPARLEGDRVEGRLVQPGLVEAAECILKHLFQQRGPVVDTHLVSGRRSQHAGDDFVAGSG